MGLQKIQAVVTQWLQSKQKVLRFILLDPPSFPSPLKNKKSTCGAVALSHVGERKQCLLPFMSPITGPSTMGDPA